MADHCHAAPPLAMGRVVLVVCVLRILGVDDPNGNLRNIGEHIPYRQESRRGRPFSLEQGRSPEYYGGLRSDKREIPDDTVDFAGGEHRRPAGANKPAR